MLLSSRPPAELESPANWKWEETLLGQEITFSEEIGGKAVRKPRLPGALMESYGRDVRQC